MEGYYFTFILIYDLLTVLNKSGALRFLVVLKIRGQNYKKICFFFTVYIV